MGTLPDRSYLKELIHSCDYSNLKSFDETTGISGFEAKLDNDFVEYRFILEPAITDQEKSFTIAEINGEPTPKTQTLADILPLKEAEETTNKPVDEEPRKELSKSPQRKKSGGTDLPKKEEYRKSPKREKDFQKSPESNMPKDGFPSSPELNYQDGLPTSPESMKSDIKTGGLQGAQTDSKDVVV